MVNKKNLDDYSTRAKDYDLLRYTKKEDRFIDLIRRNKIKKLLKPNKNMKILDVGTGTGSGVIFFSRNVKEITGLDGTKAMLDEAKKKIKKLNIQNAKLVHSNALKMPFKDEEFDAVISLNFIHLFKPVSRQREFVKEMTRVLKKGGHLVLELDNYHHCHELGNKRKDLEKLTNLKIEKIIGTTLTKTRIAYRISKKLAKLYANFANLPILKNYAHRFVVRYRK